MAGAAAEVKVRDLTPESKSVNLTVKVVSVGAPQSVAAKTGGTRTVTEVVVGDETATVVLSLWDEQSRGVQAGQVLRVENGYVSLVKGRVHLNVGRYGTIGKGQGHGDIPTVNAELNVSEVDHSSGRGGDRDLGGAMDLRFRRGPPASTGWGMDEDARARGIRVRRRGESDRDRDDYRRRRR